MAAHSQPKPLTVRCWRHVVSLSPNIVAGRGNSATPSAVCGPLVRERALPAPIWGDRSRGRGRGGCPRPVAVSQGAPAPKAARAARRGPASRPGFDPKRRRGRAPPPIEISWAVCLRPTARRWREAARAAGRRPGNRFRRRAQMPTDGVLKRGVQIL